jgi:carboxypeptidase T
MEPMRIRGLGSMAVALLLVTGLAAGPAAAADPQFPPGNSGYHTYPEMTAEVAATAQAHPGIVQRFSIGKSYQGREIWAVKVSDNVATDEREPEVLFDGLHHADEHMSQEMTLAILHWLVSGYGTDATITRLVDTREIWIVFGLNPDGATYDIAGRVYHHWRKNRQPTPGATAIGTDLNRNYAYRWGCCGGASKDPASSRFRGPTSFSAPETRALRDFVASRVVDGRQQIRAGISFHTTGRLVMWPYGYTLTDIPSDMAFKDHAALVAMGKAMAATNGYKPEQASDLYISSGTSRDWMYGTYRIFEFTFEMSPDSTPYPADEAIPTETGRNRDAVLYLIDMADCPYRSIGLSVVTCRVSTGAS